MERIYLQILSVSIVFTICNVEPTLPQRDSLVRGVVQTVMCIEYSADDMPSIAERTASRKVAGQSIVNVYCPLAETTDCSLDNSFDLVDSPLVSRLLFSSIRQRAGPIC